MNIRKLILTLGIVGQVLLCQAQLLPTWTVYPSDFPHATTLTFELEAEEAPLPGPGNLLLARVDGEVRGVAQAVEMAGREIFFLTIYGEQTQAEMVSFQAYSAAKDSIYDVLDSLTFSTHLVPNSPEDPWLLRVGASPANESSPEGTAAQAVTKALPPSAQATVFPNPTRGAFAVEGEGLLGVEVSTLQGQRLHRQTLWGSTGQLNLNLTPGLYLVRIAQQQGESVRLLRVE